jgi:hypothetical protein
MKLRIADEVFLLDQIVVVDLRFPVGKSTRVRVIFTNKSKRDFLKDAEEIRNSKETLKALNASMITSCDRFINPKHVVSTDAIVDILGRSVVLVNFDNEETLTLIEDQGPEFVKRFKKWVRDQKDTDS